MENTSRISGKLPSEVSERIDIVRFIFMIMVVYIHSRALPVFSFEFEVPEWVQVTKDFVSGTMSMIPQVSPAFSSEQYSISFFGDVFNSYCGKQPLYYPFWFLRDLFLINLIAPALKRAADRFPAITATLFLMLYYSGISFPYYIPINSLMYWMIGLYLAKSGIDLCMLDMISGTAWALATAVAADSSFLIHNSIVSLVYILIAFETCFYAAGIFKNKNHYGIILKWSKYTFFVYAFHEFYEAMIKKVIMSIVPQHSIIQLIEFILLPIAVVALCMWIGWVIHTRLPKVYRLVTGGRTDWQVSFF